MRIGDSYIPPQITDVNKYTLPAESQPAVVAAGAEDLLEISAESRQKAAEDKNGQMDIERLREQLENARAQGEAMGEEMTKRIKCLRIAMRIMAGDKVPTEDHRYLAENEPELYARALMMKMENENPKKHKRLSEDEQADDGEKASATGSEGAPAAEISAEAAPPTDDSGGEASAGDGGAEAS